MTRVQIQNPSAHTPLRIFSQNRTREFFVDAPTSAPLPKRHTREELHKIGSEIIDVPSKGTALEDGVMKAVTRSVPTPFYRTANFESLAEFITESAERELRAQQAAASAAAMMASAGTARTQRVLDDWNTAPQELSWIPPGEKIVVNQLEEHKRLVIESDLEAALQIQNESHTRTLRLRNRDSKSGAQTHVAFLAPLQVGLVIANKNSAACVELMPS